MFVARSFAFTSPLQAADTRDKPAPSPRPRSPRRTAYASPPTWPLNRTHAQQGHEPDRSREPSRDRHPPAADVPPPSSPVPVPPSPRSAASSRHSSRPSSHQGYPFPINEAGSLTSQLEPTPAQPSPKHDAAALPPAVAALLAMTTIPPRRKGQKLRQPQPVSRPRHMSLSELVEEWHAMDLGDASSFSPSSPAMEFLLSAPEHESALARSPSDDDLPDRFTFAARSQSEDSIPSLDSECRSLQSAIDPVTPLPSAPGGEETSSIKSGGSGRREKDKWSPRSVDCACDHPLLQMAGPDDLDSSTSIPRHRHPDRKVRHRQPHHLHHRYYHPRHLLQHLPSHRQRLQPTSVPSNPSVQAVKYQTSKSWRPLSNFRSNLTASLETLKSAATTISNFTAPSLTPDDYLSQSLFDTLTPYRSEVRPRFSGIPTAQVRRYFNPGPPPAGDTRLEFHLHNSYIDQTDLLTVSLDPTDISHEHVIPMQTYIRASNAIPHLKHGDGSSVQSQPPTAIDLLPGLRQREPRENSAFLRVCVLEMNMRRQGKLDPQAAFKARFWLPPRQVSNSVAELGRDSSDTATSKRSLASVLSDIKNGGTSVGVEEIDEDDVDGSQTRSRGRQYVPVRWRGISAS